MTNRLRSFVLGFSLLLVAVPALAEDIHLTTLLRGFEEVPSLANFARGRFHAILNEELTEVTYTLNYRNVEGTVTQAHIHLAQPGVNGGIMVFLCSNLGNGPARRLPPPIPPRSPGPLPPPMSWRSTGRTSSPATSASSRTRCDRGSPTPTSIPPSGRAASSAVRFVWRKTTTGTELAPVARAHARREQAPRLAGRDVQHQTALGIVQGSRRIGKLLVVAAARGVGTMMRIKMPGKTG